jgi:hypothetical protein
MPIQFLYWRIRISIHRSSPIHCPQGLSIYRPPIISSLRATHLRAHVAYKQQRDPRFASEQQPSYLHSSTGCALQQFGAWCSCRGSFPALWPDSTKVWGVLKMLLTAYAHGSAAPTGPWCGTIAVLGEQMIWIYLEVLAQPAGCQAAASANWAPATGPPAERHRAPPAGFGGGVSAERIPRVTPPNLARRGEIVNRIKKD